MLDAGFLSVFLLGLLGGTHCVGMCGGIVSAFTVQMPGRGPAWPMQLAYNAGRISSYALAGALMGSIGGLGMLLDNLLPIQLGLYLLANLMLIAMGLYLLGVSRALAPLERFGQRLWQRLRPCTQRFLPSRTPSQAFSLGMLWGWLPCGLVYGVLAIALVSGSAARGAGTMLAFGLGTLPNLLLAGLMLVRFRRVMQERFVRTGSGVLVIGFGLYGLLNGTTLGGRLWQGVVCHV